LAMLRCPGTSRCFHFLAMRSSVMLIILSVMGYSRGWSDEATQLIGPQASPFKPTHSPMSRRSRPKKCGKWTSLRKGCDRKARTASRPNSRSNSVLRYVAGRLISSGRPSFLASSFTCLRMRFWRERRDENHRAWLSVTAGAKAPTHASRRHNRTRGLTLVCRRGTIP